MKLEEFNKGPRHTGFYWVKWRNGADSTAWGIVAYAHGRTPHNWQRVGVAGWRTADELGIEEIYEYLGTAPAAAKDAGIASTPMPVIPSAELSPPPTAAPSATLPRPLDRRRIQPAPLPNGFQDLPRIPDREIMDDVPLRRPTARDQSRGAAE